MAEENKPNAVKESKEVKHPVNHTSDNKVENNDKSLASHTSDNKVIDNDKNKMETKVEDKKQDKKEEKKIVKKEEAVARGADMSISKKHCMYICKFIKGKDVDTSIKQLEEVIKLKRAIPFKGEIPHRHGDMMSGRYPVSASKVMIGVLKGLRGNIIANGMDVEKSKIYFASANWASRPARKGGMRFKRAHVILKAKEIVTPQRESPQHKRGASQQESNDTNKENKK